MRYNINMGSKRITVTIVDHVYCKTNREGRRFLAPCLSYFASSWRQGQYKKIETLNKKNMIDISGRFLIGLLPRVEKYCKFKKYELTINDLRTKLPNIPLDMNNFNRFVKKTKELIKENYRENQMEKQISLINSAITKGHGVIVSPTGSGKTTLAMGVVSYYPKYKFLYIVHTKSLASQTSKNFKEYGVSVSTIMEGNKDQSGQIVVGTRQSLVSMKLEKYDFVIIDEVHHMSDEDSQYGKILTKINHNRKFGFTATHKETKEKVKLAIEGLIGGVIEEFTREEAQKMEILAKPSVKIIKIPRQFIESSKYEDVYKEAVVNSRIRNKIICETVKNFIKDNKTVMIYVTLISHGKEIQKVAKSLFNMKIPFIYSKTSSERREELKSKIRRKELLKFITTNVWKEGIDIPELDVVINANGGKDDLQIVQLMGRGLRKTARKNKMTFVDFFDQSNHFLIKHFGNRVSLYCKEGWL